MTEFATIGTMKEAPAKVGTAISGVTLTALLFGGWEARGMLEEQLRQQEQTQRSVHALQQESADMRNKIDNLSHRVDENRKLEAKLDKLRARLDSIEKRQERRSRGRR